MEITDFISPDRIALDLRMRDKGQLLAELAKRAGPSSGVDADAILAALQSREALGSTGLGKGFALPHARLEGLTRFVGWFVRLARPIDYDAIDGTPVDLVFLLLMPADTGNANVGALAAVSRKFRNPDLMMRLRKTDAAGAFTLLTLP